MELFFDAFRRSNPETQLPESVTVVSNLRLDLSKVTFHKSNLRTELSKITVHMSNVRMEKSDGSDAAVPFSSGSLLH